MNILCIIAGHKWESRRASVSWTIYYTFHEIDEGNEIMYCSHCKRCGIMRIPKVSYILKKAGTDIMGSAHLADLIKE